MATDSRNRPSTGLPAEVIEDILSVPRRRLLLECLSDNTDGLVVDDLAACVCAREEGVPPERVDPDERRRARTEIYDNHLPKLTATGVVQYDSMREQVELLTPDIVGDPR